MRTPPPCALREHLANAIQIGRPFGSRNWTILLAEREYRHIDDPDRVEPYFATIENPTKARKRLGRERTHVRRSASRGGDQK